MAINKYLPAQSKPYEKHFWMQTTCIWRITGNECQKYFSILNTIICFKQKKWKCCVVESWQGKQVTKLCYCNYLDVHKTALCLACCYSIDRLWYCDFLLAFELFLFWNSWDWLIESQVSFLYLNCVLLIKQKSFPLYVQFIIWRAIWMCCKRFLVLFQNHT